jgi:hypothetical protein
MNTKDFFNIFDERTVSTLIDYFIKTQKSSVFNKSDLINRKKEITHLSIVDSMYRFIIPLIIQNVLTNKSNVDNLNIKSLSNIKDSAAVEAIWKFDYDIKKPMYINLDTGFKIYDVITKRKCKDVLNFGTGWGSSNIYASLGLAKNGGGSITTLEHLSAFTDISKYIYRIASGFGIPLVNDVDYVDCDLIKIKNHGSYGLFRNFIKSKSCQSLLRGRKMSLPMQTYNFNTKKRFDFIIIDGPPVFRIPTFMLGLSLIKDNGFIVFENCRKEVPFLKDLGIKFKEEYGKRQKKLKKGHKIYSTSVLKVTKKIKKRFIDV